MELIFKLLLFVVVFAILFIFYELHVIDIKVKMLTEELESMRRIYMISNQEEKNK